MATMRDIRRRIKTVRNIQQITKALKMVAAARLQKAESRAKSARPYAEEMLTVIRSLASGAGEIEHPLLEIREPVKIGILAITSDRGMAGSYNSNVNRKVLDMIRHYGKDRVRLITVGKRGRLFLGKQGVEIIGEFPMPSSEIRFLEAREISRTIRDLFEAHELDEVHIVYTRFYTAVTQKVTEIQLLPAAPPEGDSAQAHEEFIFEPRPELLLGSLLPRYVDTQVYRALLESLASEHGARMTAMSSATDSATEMIDRLTLDLNRARQAAITKELSEIVSGAEALK